MRDGCECERCTEQREKAAAAIHGAAVSEWALAAWRGEPVSDFAESFAEVREAMDGRAALIATIRELRQQVEDSIAAGQTDSDAEGWITAYHFKTGAIHRLLAKAREPLGFPVGEVFQTTPPPAPAPAAGREGEGE